MHDRLSGSQTMEETALITAGNEDVLRLTAQAATEVYGHRINFSVRFSDYDDETTQEVRRVTITTSAPVQESFFYPLGPFWLTVNTLDIARAINEEPISLNEAKIVFAANEAGINTVNILLHATCANQSWQQVLPKLIPTAT